MKKLLAGLIIIVGLFLVVAIYNDWLNIKTSQNKLEIDANPSKMKDDLKKGKDVVQDKSTQLIESAKDKFGKKDTPAATGTNNK